MKKNILKKKQKINFTKMEKNNLIRNVNMARFKLKLVFQKVQKCWKYKF